MGDSQPKIRVGHKYWWGEFLVRVMALAEDYAMVRRPGAMPFVLTCRELWRSHTSVGPGVVVLVEDPSRG